MALIDGNLIKEHLKNECKQYKSQLQGKEIAIIRFEAPKNTNQERKARYDAAKVSAEQKVKTFESIGVTSKHIILQPDIQVEEFQKLIESINQDQNVTAAIVQYPVPPQFLESIQLLDSSKDIDCVRQKSNELFTSPATAEGIVQIVQSYAQSDSQVAIIGGDGFIGKGVANYLLESGINFFVLEENDDKSRTSEADIVVTVTGVPGLATPYILPQHRLVVDGGFTPTSDQPKGDVDRTAYSIPQNITPVPGGIGPIEMAILAERFVKIELGVELPKWNYQQLKQQQLERAAEIAPTVRALFEREMVNNRQNIRRIDNNQFALLGKNYNIIYDRKEESLKLKRTDDTVSLIKLDIASNQVQIARGLTEEDKTQWQRIKGVIEREQPPNRGIDR